jgi:menaquinone-dependent protoporphyrinogen oxidase
MSQILVVYASKHGATEEIAAAIAGELRQAGHTVDFVSAERAKELGPYDAAVIGSAVYMGRWRPAARRLLKRVGEEFEGRPIWLFSSGPCGQAEPSWASPPGSEKRAERMSARGHVVFGGRVPLEPSNFIERGMARNCPPDYRDLRSWKTIRSWTADIGTELAHHSGTELARAGERVSAP